MPSGFRITDSTDIIVAKLSCKRNDRHSESCLLIGAWAPNLCRCSRCLEAQVAWEWALDPQ